MTRTGTGTDSFLGQAKGCSHLVQPRVLPSPDSHPSGATSASPEPAVATAQLPSSPSSEQPLPGTHQVPLLWELGVCGLHENVSLGPALCHLLLQPLHLGTGKAWGSPAALSAASWPAASSLPRGALPGELTASSGLAEQLTPPAAAAPRPSPRPPLPSRAVPGQQHRQPHERLRSSGAGRSERRALLSSGLPRAASAATRRMPRCAQPARGLGRSQGTEGLAAPAHRRAGTWRCRQRPAHLAPVQRRRAQQGAEATPRPGTAAAHRTATPALPPLPLPATCWAPTGTASGRLTAAQPHPVPRAGSHASVKYPGPMPGPCRQQAGPPRCTYLRLPGQTAVRGLVGREGTLHHTAVPKVVIVTKDL